LGGRFSHKRERCNIGYETSFTGKFKVTPTLKPEHLSYLAKFNETRRMRRDEKVTAGRPDPVRLPTGLPVGPDGCFFVGGEGLSGQEDIPESANSFREHYANVGIIDYNSPPSFQPGLWCCWQPTKDGKGIWVPFENKHYDKIEWLNYIITNFLAPWGYSLNGKVKWKGESSDDRGYICVSNNTVFVNEQPTVLDRLVETVNHKKKAKKRS
jgi:hypothetical protein